MARLDEKIALVTGAGRGIGRAMAVRLAQEGAYVVVADIDRRLAEETAVQVAGLGRKSLTLQADVSRRADIEQMVQRSVESMGRIDILMNNAGVLRIQEVLDITEADWDFVCNVNLRGAFFVMQAVARQMIQQGKGGKIVNTASISGKQPEPHFLHYGVSKAGVISMTKSAAVAFGPHHINVNAICPGTTITDMSMMAMHARAERNQVSVEEEIQRRVATLPTGRRNQPEDIAAMAVFLASPDADNITGQAYNVDGGAVMIA
jgi:meso-butanediol dehydrogenase/(S,S)-butanediol dehydrogenase/diacetyl reductase